MPIVHISGIHLTASCVDDKLFTYSADLGRRNAHSLHGPWRPTSDHNYLPYAGNGYIGLETEGVGGQIHLFGALRHLSLPVPLKPVVQLTPMMPSGAGGMLAEEAATVVHYTSGLVHNVRCTQIRAGGAPQQKVGVSSVMYAHRAIRSVFVQEVKLTNPTAEDVTFNVERMDYFGEWKDLERISVLFISQLGRLCRGGGAAILDAQEEGRTHFASHTLTWKERRFEE